MAIVAGVDFGTLSVRATLIDTSSGRLGSGVAEYPLKHKREDPEHATQSHDDHMRGLVDAMRSALARPAFPAIKSPPWPSTQLVRVSFP
jgi:L-ribulokinase